MNTNSRFECDICNLYSNSKKDYLKHNRSDYHINGAREGYEQKHDFVAKVDSNDNDNA